MSFGDLGTNELTAINRRNEARLAQVSHAMTTTQQTIAETEEIGLSIMDEMETQSEQLVATRDGVKETPSLAARRPRTRGLCQKKPKSPKVGASVM